MFKGMYNLALGNEVGTASMNVSSKAAGQSYVEKNGDNNLKIPITTRALLPLPTLNCCPINFRLLKLMSKVMKKQ